MLIALSSHRGSPGVTTLALALARFADSKGWESVLVEADPDGGVIRHLLPDLDPEKNLLSFAVAARRDPSGATLQDHAQQLDAGTGAKVLLAPPVGPQVARALDLIGDSIRDIARHPGRFVVLDCGRIANAAARLFATADAKWLLTRPDAASVLALRELMVAHPDEATRIGVILVGDEPYGPDDLAEIGINVAGNLAEDPRTADAVRGVGNQLSVKKFVKSKLVKSVEDLVPDLPAEVHTDIVGDRGISIAVGGSEEELFTGPGDRPETVAELEARTSDDTDHEPTASPAPTGTVITDVPPPADATTGDDPVDDTTDAEVEDREVVTVGAPTDTEPESDAAPKRRRFRRS